jgi:hypothetical protein
LDSLGETSGDKDVLLLKAALDGGLSVGFAKDALDDYDISPSGNAAKVSLPRHHVLFEARGATCPCSRIVGRISRWLGGSRRLTATSKPNAELAPALWRVVDDGEQVSPAPEPTTETGEDESCKTDQEEPGKRDTSLPAGDGVAFREV